MTTEQTVEQQIDERIGEVRTDSFDMSFGEIVNLHENQELIIQPEYQRLFRWSDNQKSSLIESILLELPVPQIFVIENQDGVFELIDGLQRVSSVIQFLSPNSLGLDPLVLSGCSLIPALDSKSLKDLPLSLKPRIKRSTIRMIVIRKQSQGFLRYEMFKRLHTGGSNLEPQKIRNCSARMLGAQGVEFYSFLVELAKSEHFAKCASFLPDPVLEQKGDEELVLRYLATKNASDNFKGSVRDWLDTYMEKILLSSNPFPFDQERAEFLEVFQCAFDKLGETAFLRYREEKPVGSLAPAYFEAIAIAIKRKLAHLQQKTAADVRNKVTEVIQSDVFRNVTGPGANSKEKLKQRIELVANALGAI